MAFSDDERGEILETLKRIEGDIEDIKGWQGRQDGRLDTLERAIEDNPENNNLGMRTKVNEVYTTIQSWQDQVKGARFVVGILLFIFTSGLGLLLYNAFAGGTP